MAVSVGNLMRRSTSTGDYPGARLLIRTWTLVMSGPAALAGASRVDARRDALRAYDKAGREPLPGVGHDRSGKRALGVAAAARRQIRDLGLDRRPAVGGVDENLIADVDPRQIAPVDGEIDPNRR